LLVWKQEAQALCRGANRFEQIDPSKLAIRFKPWIRQKPESLKVNTEES
jgi:hypothetical protein